MDGTSRERLHEVQEVIADRTYAELRWQLIILGLFRFSEALAWTTMFPYVFLMMQSFLPEDPSQAGQAAAYASLSVALFTFGEFLTSLLWAKVSDNIGRKSTLIIGVFGGIASALVFGFSTNVWMALSARFIGGLLNPNAGVVSACVGELVKKNEHQGKGYSIVPFLRGLGSLIGPVIGGHLADPVRNIPSLFSEGIIWGTFPYLLPNVIVVLFILTSGMVGFFFLEESNDQMQTKVDSGRIFSKWLGRKLGFSGNYAELAVNEEEEAELTSTSLSKEETNEDELSTLHVSTDLVLPRTSGCTKRVILQVIAVSLLAFHKVSSDVIIPTFLATPSTSENSSDSTTTNIFKFKYGFGMDTPSIANVLLTQAIVAIVSQILIVPKIVDHLGPLVTLRWSTFVFPWLYCLTPFTVQLPHPLSVVTILVDLWTKGILVNLGYVSSAIMLTKSTPTPYQLATVNGAAAAIGCLARSVGAAVSGSMFHAGLASGYIGLPFWTLGVVAAAGALVTWFLDDKP